MKKWLLFLSLLALPLGLAQVRTFEQIQRAGEIRIGTEGAFPPFNYFDAKNQLTGFEIDLGNALAKKLGLKATWITQAFDTLLIQLNQGRFDFVIASHGITEERAKAVDFTNPHYCTGGVIVAKRGGPKTAKDLQGKVVGVQLGTTYMEAAQKIPGVKGVRTYQKDPDALQDLLAGRLDAWITDRFVAKEAIKERKLEGTLQLGELVFQEKVAMAVAKGNKSVLEALNRALADLMKDGTYAQVSKKWFGEDVRCR
ncbi:MAG: ABC transporter substrate-binding protein [Thermus sp.]|uniref:ABC transporter substrate-binding protein n=1 Tax=Thermus sp. TaxID=275 RepID=UPI0025EAFFDA|nr:ABC transporter substrate-binding protein [Thermus sp.]MCS6867355.1 ABC transporter substrate-binding protein [Thermus sp.]MCS7218099.1 ABC transporter substrate-binding protein [Thermus sp.]MCX7849863.1 ABC transporter substrate-binding protein [Thermus sp.]MDW8017957.1 ABC transporter substrate-binding protein [Thermus sp.]MDW8357693.1 ABC transporter substrate-binding protein [Thermus sp.]